MHFIAMSQVIMKKFVQLFLIIFSVISTSLFVFYKHEYNRLRGVLEVLDTFGSNVEIKPSEVLEVNRIADGFTAFSVWRKVGPMFTYSAFAEQDEKHTTIYILAIVQSSFKHTGACSVWFDNMKIPISGTLSIHQLLNQSNADAALKPVLLKCTVARAGDVPHAVTPSTIYQERPAEAIDVIYDSLKSGQKKGNEVHACLLPFSDFFNSPLQLAEFLVFHKAVGIERFYIYVNTISLAVKKLISAYMQNATYVVNYWSLPEELNQESILPITERILMNDCLFRSRSRASFLIITNTEKFLVPKHHSTVGGVLGDVTAVVKHPVSQIRCQYRVFCTEQSKHIQSGTHKGSSSILEKTQWHFQGNHLKDYFNIFNIDKISFISSTSVDPDSYNVPFDVMMIHWYKVCKPSDGLSLRKSSISNAEKEKLSWLKELFTKSSLIRYALLLS